jgi:hypothetical protein
MYEEKNLSSFYNETVERYRQVSHLLEKSSLPLAEQEKLEKKQKALLTKLLYLEKQTDRQDNSQNLSAAKEKMKIYKKSNRHLGFFGVLFEMLQKIGLIKEAPQTPTERKPLINAFIMEIPSLRKAQKQKKQRLLAIRQAYFNEKRMSAAKVATYSKENLRQILLKASQQRQSFQRAA